MKRSGATLILEQDDQYVKFTKLLEKATNEGRVDGRFRCTVCGMRFHEERDADACCARVPRH